LSPFDPDHPTHDSDVPTFVGEPSNTPGGAPRSVTRAVPPEKPVSTPDERYEIVELLGEGGSGRVYAATDKRLGREIALKVVDRRNEVVREMFLQEARVTASLDHPNVPPIYDVGDTADAVFLTMKRVTGRTLGDRIRDAAEGRSEPMSADDLIGTMLRVCDALSYAHARGIIHKDVKPDNVIIGSFGEVMLVDWGAATGSTDGMLPDQHVVGTPTYMAPEQVSGLPTPASDIYSLGATLFHALLLRRPLTDKNPDSFWMRKFRGEIDMPTAEELSRVPRGLLAIALRAMHVTPAGRYRDVASFAEALRDFGSGSGAWTTPVVSETFDDDSYRERWALSDPKDYRVEAGHLHVSAPSAGFLVYRSRFAAGVAIEFDAEILPDAPGGDLSVLWIEDDVIDGDVAHWPRTGTTFGLKTGAFDNTRAGIYKGVCLSGIAHALEKGRLYRVRAEIDGSMLRLMLDGEILAEYEEMFPISTGHIAILTYFPGKVIHSARIFERGFAERVRPTVVGDYAYARGDFLDAARQYGRIEAVLGSSQLVEEARYKRGLALFAAKEREKAREAWRGLHDPGLLARTRVQESESAFEAGDHQQVVAILAEVLAQAPALRPFVINRWADLLARYLHSTEFGAEPYLALRDRKFPDDVASAPAAADALYATCRFDDVIRRFADQKVEVSRALIAVGRCDEVAAMHAQGTWLHSYAVLLAGRPDRVPEGGSLHDIALVYAGRPQEALREARSDYTLIANGLCSDVAPGTGTEWGTALRRLGRLDEAIAMGDVRAMVERGAGEEILHLTRHYWQRVYALRYLAIRAFLGGETEGYRRFSAMAKALPQSCYWESMCVLSFIVFPLIDDLCGQKGALSASLELAAERYTNAFRGVLAPMAEHILGRMGDDAFLALPMRGWAPGRLWFCKAVRAELQGDRIRAAEHYQRFLALPAQDRGIDCVHGDPVLELWARERSRVER
jgi:tetratricopeptide (TPR) repeat protein